MKKVLILGGNSDIGLELINSLINDDTIKLHVHYNTKFPKKTYNKKVKLIKKNLLYINIKNLDKTFDKDYDVIINLIGYLSNQSFSKFNIKEIQKTIYINSLIPLLIIKNSLKNMAKKKYGRIINTSSIGVKYGGGNETFAYSLSKHINEFIPRDIRKLYSYNIYYNVIRIGVTDTKIHNKIRNKFLKKRIKLIPAKKMAKTIDIVNYIYFLIFKNNFTTNEIISISGGE